MGPRFSRFVHLLRCSGGVDPRVNPIARAVVEVFLLPNGNELFDAITWKAEWNVNASGLDPNSFTPYQPAWKKYIGTYRIRWNGYKPYTYAKILLALLGYPEYEAQVYEKDAYLEILYLGRHVRLDEYQPVLFFTQHGECLDLRGEVPTWQIYRLKKIK